MSDAHEIPDEVYVMIIEDRHTDVEVQAFRTEEGARAALVDYRQELIKWKGRDDWDEEEMIDDEDGWIVNVSYSSESDYVRIQKVAVH